MQYRRLGHTDLEPSVLGFGCSMIASLATRHPRREVERTLGEALDAGINFFDTADVYGQGDSERLLGTLFRTKRKDMIVCTKAGLTVGPLEAVVRAIKPIANVVVRRWRAAGRVTEARRRSEGQCFAPHYLCRRIEGSLRRLGTGQIDLFFLHNPPVDVPQRDMVFDVLGRLKEQGKMRHLGVSCRSLADADEWIQQPGVACVQIPIDRMRLAASIPLLQGAWSRGVGVIAREVFAANAGAQAAASDVLTPLVQRHDIGVVLAGMTCREHLRANLHAVDIALR